LGQHVLALLLTALFHFVWRGFRFVFYKQDSADYPDKSDKNAHVKNGIVVTLLELPAILKRQFKEAFNSGLNKRCGRCR
jgi:hypothetical protein